MGTISSAFTIITSALQADQQALNVVANNVANANTAGYTRELPNFQENETVQIGSNSYGMGVTEDGATSVRDRVLTERLDQQTQLSTAASTRLSSLDTVQALFTPSSSSTSASAGDIGTDVTEFFASLSTLETEPTSNAYRQSVISDAGTLSADISGAASSLNSQRASIDQEAAGITSQVNALTTSIASLNIQIETNSPNSDAGVMEDQRQADITSLSKLVGINQITTENNGISLTTTGGTLLVSGASSYALTNGTVDGMTHIFSGTVDITSDLTTGGGELGGYLTVRDTDIPSVLNSLDTLAYNVSTKVNALNNTGSTLDGTTGTASNPNYIFSEPTAVNGAAAAMSVVITDPAMVAAAGKNAGTGDNTNAVSMAALGSADIVGGDTPSNFYSAIVSALGSTVSQASTESTTLTASVTQLQTQSDALSAVSLDDEASSMTTLQRAYQAASQVFSILDNIMNSALNLGEATTVS